MSYKGVTPFGFDRPPDHVNEKGVEWWLDRESTGWARRENGCGVSLPNAVVWLVREPDGRMTRLLVEGQDFLHEATSLEDMACHIDMLKVIRTPE